MKRGQTKNKKSRLTAAVFCFAASQCRQVKITILGEEGVPVQVDGEAWIQPPGIVKIVHKNRAQMLTRDRVMSCTCPFHSSTPQSMLSSIPMSLVQMPWPAAAGLHDAVFWF